LAVVVLLYPLPRNFLDDVPSFLFSLPKVFLFFFRTPPPNPAASAFSMELFSFFFTFSLFHVFFVKDDNSPSRLVSWFFFFFEE